MDLGIQGLTDITEIGSGGSAVVYSAVQSALGRHVAVKILNVRFGVGNETERRRFEREQIALGRVSDLSGIVPLYESGFTDTGRPYLIMPFYEAGSLQGRLDAEGALPWREASELMISVARSVQRAHDDSVLHRDLKPANIMIGRDGSPVVGDFGVARLLGSTTLFQSRALSTTPAYAPPEVFAGEESTVAVDVYGLGATLFALVNGSPAFVSLSGDMNVLALMRRVDLDPVPDLRERGVPDAIAAVIERAMAKAPSDRHATAAEWADDLERALGAASVAAEPAGFVPPAIPVAAGREPEPAAAEPVEPEPAEPAVTEPVVTEPVVTERAKTVVAPSAAVAGDDEHDAGRRTWAWVLGGVGALVVGLIVIGALAGDGDGGDDPADAPAATAAPDPTDPDEEAAVTTEPGDPDAVAATAATDPPTVAPTDRITVIGPERGEAEVAALERVFGEWGADRGIGVDYVADLDLATSVELRVDAGDPPDIAIVPQPGKLAEWARAGDLTALDDGAVATARANWPASWNDLGVVDGLQFGVPVAADVKSLVWYVPARFAAAGYEVPSTFADFTTLIGQMSADDGPKPLCVGIESGGATGWAYTDWVEDMVLRQHGAEVYDQWVAHEIPFNDPRIVESMETVLGLWSEQNVFAAAGSITGTSFADNAPALAADECYMHRQASFFATWFPDGVPVGGGAPEAVDVFYLPDFHDDRPLLVSGLFATVLNERPEVHELAAFMSSAEYAERRQTAEVEASETESPATGFLSANPAVDRSVFTPIERSFVDILASSDNVRFDASDQMPPEVGFGSFWVEGTRAVGGEVSAQEAADAIEASWPP